MPDTKITALTAIGANPIIPATFPIPMVDLTDTSMAASGTTKKVTVNQILGAGGTATLASATITGDLTVDTSTLKVDSTNNRVGIGTASPTGVADFLSAVVGNSNVLTIGNNEYGGATYLSSNSVSLAFNRGQSFKTGAIVSSNTTNGNLSEGYIAFQTSTSNVLTERYRIDNTGISTWSVGGSTAMTLNSTGLGVGVVPSLYKFELGNGGSDTRAIFNPNNAFSIGVKNGSNQLGGWIGSSGNNVLTFSGNDGTMKMTIDNSGNVGIGVTPSYKLDVLGVSAATVASGAAFRAIRSSSGDRCLIVPLAAGSGFTIQSQNAAESDFTPIIFSGSTTTFNYRTGVGTVTAGMTLDASGNLLVGLTSGTYNRIKKDSAADAGNAIFELVGASNATSSIHYSVSSYNANAANAASKFGRDATTLRSINAGGTVNASGADYAEYMVKCGDFTLSKGGIAGIDSNGKLTNVFADAVSFVVKSTDPSYVGNDKWGVDLEGDALEAARQLVDRIAFAGQVPVNVIGAKAGDYIVPVVDGTGIKGIAVTSPTFEQYQIAVGKVIAIDTDGRARIIVKLA